MAMRFDSRDLGRASRSPVHHLLLAAMASTGLFVAGCQNSAGDPAGHKSGGDGQLAIKDPAGDSVAQWPQVTPEPPASTEMPKLDFAAVVASRARGYAAQIGPAVDRHVQGALTKPAPVPKSEVKWEVPGPATQPTKPVVEPVVEPVVVPFVKPIIDSSPGTSNQMAALPGTGTANPTGVVFRVTPEDVNHTPSAASAAPAGDPLEAKLLKHIKDNPRDVWAQLDYQLLQFVHDRRDPTMSALAGLPLEDRELVTSVVDALNNFREAVRSDGNMLLSKKVRAFLELADRLRSQADLTIPTLALCRKVDGFGVYEPIDPARFIAGKEHMAIVYCEVDNFASQVNDRKQWETKLTQETVLYREDGLAVWQDKTKSIVDLSRNRRHDFFMVKIVTLPSTLTIGRYLMKVSIQDLQANRVSEATVPVEIVAQ